MCFPQRFWWNVNISGLTDLNGWHIQNQRTEYFINIVYFFSRKEGDVGCEKLRRFIIKEFSSWKNAIEAFKAHKQNRLSHYYLFLEKIV